MEMGLGLCPYRELNPAVFMMKPAQDWPRHDPSE
jgi:hypothetical protein